MHIQRFNEAAERIKMLTKRPSDQELLRMYAFFKQSTFGDNNTSKPGMLDLKGKAKWNAWNEIKGMSQDESKENYIAYVDQLMEKYKE